MIFSPEPNLHKIRTLNHSCDYNNKVKNPVDTLKNCFNLQYETPTIFHFAWCYAHDINKIFNRLFSHHRWSTDILGINICDKLCGGLIFGRTFIVVKQYFDELQFTWPHHSPKPHHGILRDEICLDRQIISRGWAQINATDEH